MASECEDYSGSSNKISKANLVGLMLSKRRTGNDVKSTSNNEKIGNKSNPSREEIGDHPRTSREEIGDKSSREEIGNKSTSSREEIGDKSKSSREEIGDRSKSSREDIGDKSRSSREEIGTKAKSNVDTSEENVIDEENNPESKPSSNKQRKIPMIQTGLRKVSRGRNGTDVETNEALDERTARRSSDGRKESFEGSGSEDIPQKRSRSVISVTLNNIKDHVMNTKPKKRRLLGKKGGLKVRALHVEQKGGLYFSDLFTTLVDCDWRWIIVIFASCFVGSWIFFGLLWLAVAKSRTPFECLDNVNSFASALLFSIETQSTIGYGGRMVTPSCPDAIILLIAQSLIGFLMSAFLLGLVFTKLARPSRRADTLLFSKNALVAPRDGRMCLLFRVGDIRESRILDAQIRVQLFRTRHTAEGQEIPFYQQDLKCGIDWSDKGSGNNTLFLILPLTIIHVIDEDSPFYEMGPQDFNSDADFEVVALLQGVVESTSMIVEARTSYLGDEIFWGRDFTQVLHENCWDDNQGRYLVDFSLFHASIPVELPLVSAKEFYSRNQADEEVKSIIRKARAKSRRILSTSTPQQEGLVKHYTELWKRKFHTIHEIDARKRSGTGDQSL